MNEQQKKRKGPPGSSAKNPLKVTVLGGFGAGKSGLVMRVDSNSFIGDFKGYLIEDEDRYVLGDTHLQVELICPEAEFAPLVQACIRFSDVILLLVDTTNKTSLEDAKRYAELVSQERDSEHPLPLVVVGTKIDLESERQLPPEEVKAFADTLGAPYIETSAKTGEGVREAFEEAAKIAIGNDNIALEGQKNKRCAIQ